MLSSVLDMKTIITIAKLNTSEWLRLKFFHVIIFFGILFICFGYLLSSLTFSVQERLLFDFGLGGLELSLVMVSSLIGSHFIHREIERKTLFVLLARPISRTYIIFGSWLSLVVLNLLFCSGFLISLVLTSEKAYLSSLITIAISILMKSLVVASFAIALGVLVRPILALVTTTSYWYLCYSLPDLQYFVKKLNDSFLTQVFNILDYFIPQFYKYNWKSYYYLLNPPNGMDQLWSFVHSFGWIFFWLFVASIAFKRKEIV